MSPANRIEADEMVTLVRELAPADKSGIPDTVLASRLNVPIDRVRSLVSRHPKYFVRVGDVPRYRLNQFDTSKGVAERILVDIERTYDRSKRLQITTVALAVIVSIIAVTALLISN